jgi:hypothetical protein
MANDTLFFWVIIDPLTFVLGSLGGFILFHEIVDLDHMPAIKEIYFLLKRRWLACLSLLIAIIYFFYRMITLLHSQ